MKVFISWSGQRSREVANALSYWIREVLQTAETWISTEIPAGTRWSDEIGKRLAETSFGIICVTPENEERPWLLFEAGALAKALDRAVVCPYLIDYADRPIPDPLRQFQAVTGDCLGTLGLVRTINAHLEKPLEDDRVERAFQRCWPELEKVLQSVAMMEPERRQELPFGLESVHLDRASALVDFRRHIEDELRRSTAGDAFRLWVVGSSLRGFLDHPGAESWLRRARDTGDSARILLTDPDITKYREKPEGKIDGMIATEVRIAVHKLRELGFARAQVRFYKGSPTAFAIATSNRMLINPYPYAAAAYSCMTLIVASTGANQNESTSDIFSQYLAAHFKRPFELSREVLPEEWESEPPFLPQVETRVPVRAARSETPLLPITANPTRRRRHRT